MIRKAVASDSAVHLFVLTHLSIAQPLFHILAVNAEFFVARNGTAVDIVTLVVALCILLPGALLFLQRSARWIHPELGTAVYRFFFLLLTCLLALTVWKSLGIQGTELLLSVAVFSALMALILYNRFPVVRTLMSCLTPALLIIPGWFLLQAPIRKIVIAPSIVSVFPPVQSTTPVVMVVFDELPIISLLDENLMIDAVRYPHFAELMQTSTWYRNTSAVSSLTDTALPPILTGSYPRRNLLPTARDYPNNLFTMLAASYRMNVLEPITQLLPPSVPNTMKRREPFRSRLPLLMADVSAIYFQLILPETLSSLTPPVNQTWSDFWGLRDSDSVSNLDRTTDFEKFLTQMNRGQDPALYFAHIPLPHKPWKYFPSGRMYHEQGSSAWFVRNEKEGIWEENESVVREMHLHHLLQVGFVDRLLGRLLDSLKQAGIYDRCFIIVTADHGAAFTPGESIRSPSPDTASQILMVPLFMKEPHQNQGKIVDRRIEVVDILPTVTEILGISIPWQTDGQSALGEGQSGRNARSFFRRNPFRVEEFKIDVRQDDKALVHKLQYFGSRSGFESMFASGPHSSLIGKRMKETDIRKTEQLQVRIRKADAYRAIDLNAQTLPAFITGSIRGSSEPVSIAIAVNDTIRATTVTFPFRRGFRFGALVPETSFLQGENEVEIYVISGHGQLTWIPATSG